MALLWQKTTGNADYQVRSAGNTVRLYKDGVFHSHYNPRLKATRAVWDLLLLPALMRPPGGVQKVLLLGLGGGAVVHLLNHFVKPQHITAIELDPVHCQIAKRFFNVRYDNCELVNGDAIQWVGRKSRYKRPPTFNLIIDDLYGEEDREPVRAVAASTDWANQLTRLLTNDGMLVSNFVTGSELRQSAYTNCQKTRKLFASIYQFSNPNYQNCIAAMSRTPLQRPQFKSNLSDFPELRSARYQNSFAFRKLK